MPDGVVTELVANLGFKADTAPLKDAESALDAVARAADRACEAIDRLGSRRHGGITIQMVGSVLHCEVKPPAEAA